MFKKGAIEHKIAEAIRSTLETYINVELSLPTSKNVFHTWLRVNNLEVRDDLIYNTSQPNIAVARLGGYTFDGKQLEVRIQPLPAIKFIQVKIDVAQ